MDFSLLQRKKAVVHKRVPVRRGLRRNKMKFFVKKADPIIRVGSRRKKRQNSLLLTGENLDDPNDRYADCRQKEKRPVGIIKVPGKLKISETVRYLE
jgi:hypothetical protein